MLEERLEGDVLCGDCEYQFSEVLGEALDLSPALQKGQGCMCMPGLPKSCEFEPRIQLLLGVNFQVSAPGTEHVIDTVCRVSPAVPPGLKPTDGFSLLAVVKAPGNAVTPC